MFVDVFPLRDPSFTSEEMDSEIQKQFEELFVSLNKTRMLKMKLLSMLTQNLLMQLKFMEFLGNCREIEVCGTENTKVNKYFKFHSMFSADAVHHFKP